MTSEMEYLRMLQVFKNQLGGLIKDKKLKKKKTKIKL